MARWKGKFHLECVKGGRKRLKESVNEYDNSDERQEHAIQGGPRRTARMRAMTTRRNSAAESEDFPG